MSESKWEYYGKDITVGEAASKNGKLISLDGDIIYDEEDAVVEYREWSKPELGIKNGLTVVIDCRGVLYDR